MVYRKILQCFGGWAILEEIHQRPFDCGKIYTPGANTTIHLHLTYALYMTVTLSFDAMVKISDVDASGMLDHSYINTRLFKQYV